MTANPPSPIELHDAQAVYARVLEWSARLGFVALVATFAAYVFGWLPPRIPAEALAQYWSRPAGDYLRLASMTPGWSWLSQLRHGDVASLVGVVILAAAPMLASLAAVPVFAARRAPALAAICVLQAAVLLLAASALLSTAR